MSTPRRKPGVNSIISTWAVEHYNLKTMCPEGYLVYEAILNLEEKGKTPAQIVRIMKKTDPGSLTFVADRADDDRNLPYLDDVEDTIAGLRGMLDMTASSNNNVFVDLSKTFQAAIKAEIKRLNGVLKQVEGADPYGKTPVFTKKRNGKVVVTFK